MKEENSEEMIDQTSESGQTVKRRPLIIASAVIGCVIIGAFLFWIFSRGDGGRAVSAPTSVKFGENGGSQPEIDGEQTLTLQAGQAEKIGLKIETVGEGLSGESMSVAATGVIEPDAYRETPVIAVVGGVIRKVNFELGQTVQKGQTVAVLNSDELAGAASDYLAMLAETDEAVKRYARALKLTDIAQESRNELDQTTSAVRIAEAEYAEMESLWTRTAKLLEIGAVSRQEYESVLSQFETAKAKLNEARKRLERAKKLLDINPQRRAELDSALTMRRTAEAKTGAMREKLLVYGLSVQDTDRIRASRRVVSELSIKSPVTGTVTERTVNPGEIIDANKELMKITNLSDVWVVAQVYDRDIAQIRVGSGASVSTDSYPNRIFRGRVTYIDPNVNQETRTAQVRVELDNPERILKIGLYVNVAFGSLGDAERTMPLVPASAVQNMIDRQIVFVPTGDQNIFSVKPVRLGTESNGRFPVIEGLNVGDKVVTDGSFLLRAELLKQQTNN